MADNRQFQEDRTNDRYIAHLTHDIVGHLATIQSCLGVALTGTLDKQSSEFVHRAYNRTCKLTDFIKTLIKLDKKIRQNGRVEMNSFSLKHTLDNIIDALKTKAGENLIQLNCSFADPLHNVYGNEPSIEEMLTNMLLIAISEAKKNGEILVCLTNQLNSTLLQISFVRDSITIVEQPKKLDKLYHDDNVSNIDKSSSDLKWITAEYIAKINGGSIIVNNKKEKEVNFTVSLPCSIR